MEQKIYSGLDSLDNLLNILEKYDVSRILIVTGKSSFTSSGAEMFIKRALSKYKTIFFNNFDPNPRLDDALKGIDLLNKNSIDLIIAIGGGSVLDMAKLIKALYKTPHAANNIVSGAQSINDPKIPMIAIPTTAGSGSESTHFAVAYINNKKFSVADNCLMPNYAILDGRLTISASKYQKACNVLDAISQSIESSWAVSGTHKSQELAYSALRLCMESFREYVNNDSLEVAQLMINASNLAGQAINISKTTSAHAWSYGISTYYDIPHGHAVWFTLPKIFEVHSSRSDLKINDPRGYSHMKNTMNNLNKILGISSHLSAEKYFKQMLNSIDIKADITNDLKISKKERKNLSCAVNKERMGNNPLAFDNKAIKFIFDL